MKAVVQDRYGGPEQLRLADLPVPCPGKGEVRVRMLACGVNLSDWEYLVGAPLYARLAGGVSRPRRAVLGSDIVGRVDQCGPGVTEFAVGDRVMGDVVMTRGGFAEYACVPAAAMTAVPEALSDEIAACSPQAGGIAVAGTEGIRRGDHVLINGAGGGSGTMALQLAKAAGAHVTAVDHAGKIDWLSALGADAVIAHDVQDFAATGRRWDRILDMVATRGPAQIARALTASGTYRAVGGRTGALLALASGGLLYRMRGQSIGILMVSTGRALTARVAQMAAKGTLTPLLDAVLPLAAVPEGLCRTGRGAVRGKLVVTP